MNLSLLAYALIHTFVVYFFTCLSFLLYFFCLLSYWSWSSKWKETGKSSSKILKRKNLLNNKFLYLIRNKNALFSFDIFFFKNMKKNKHAIHIQVKDRQYTNSLHLLITRSHGMVGYKLAIINCKVRISTS